MTVLSFAISGTVVSSPCRRSAARTCASISASSGVSVAAQVPTQSASVETLSSMPSRAKLSLCRFSGRCWPNFASRIMASRFGPARPRAIGWNGAGGWVIASQERQENRSRTVWITFHCRGTTSSVSVMSSPSLASRPPQQGQAAGAGMTTRSRGRCCGKGARAGWRRPALTAALSLPAAVSAAAASSLAAANSSPSSNSGWSISLRPRSDEAPNRSCLSLAISSFRCATIASAPEARASASCRARRSAASAACRATTSSTEVSGAGITTEIESRPACRWKSKCVTRPNYPATSGRQVRCGFRQSIPSSM